MSCIFITGMYSQDLKKKVWQARQRGFTWNQLEHNFGIPKSSCRDLVKKYGKPPSAAPKNNLKIKGNKKKRLVLAIQRLKECGERITAPKILCKSSVSVSLRSVQRFLNKEGLKYMNPQNTIVLSDRHKAERHEMCKKWLIRGSASTNIVFTDETRFPLDGPDHIMTWQDPKNRTKRECRQQGGGGVLLWGMLFRTGELFVTEVKGKIDSKKYCQVLNTFALPIITREFDHDFTLQQDNAPPHVSEYSMSFLEEKGVTLLGWPARSPDMNVIENCWKVLKNRVYENGGMKNLAELREKISATVQRFNNEPKLGQGIYSAFGERVLECYERNGNLLDC